MLVYKGEANDLALKHCINNNLVHRNDVCSYLVLLVWWLNIEGNSWLVPEDLVAMEVLLLLCYFLSALCLQLGLMLVFWLTLREKNQEKAECEWMARMDEQGSKEIKLSQTASCECILPIICIMTIL